MERWYCGIRVLRNLLDSLPKKNKKMPRCNKLRRGVFCLGGRKDFARGVSVSFFDKENNRLEGGGVAGYENIKDANSNRTPEERRKLARIAGKASGAARRRKADFRKTLNLLLTTKIDSPEWTPVLEALGLDSTLESAVNAAVIKKALEGNVQAYIAIRDTLGQTTKSQEDLEEQKIRTDRAKRARDQEVGDTGEENENIQSFLKAMNPTEEEMKNIFDEEEDGNKEEETSEI